MTHIYISSMLCIQLFRYVYLLLTEKENVTMENMRKRNKKMKNWKNPTCELCITLYVITNLVRNRVILIQETIFTGVFQPQRNYVAVTRVFDFICYNNPSSNGST